MDQGNGQDRIGAVMVVGGGIAGMQAALDLVENGFKVYLVEKKSAIGGHMAQLDKTFPTNDCAMCTISPKLVETAAHLNIKLLTNSELIKLDGEAGHFTATVRTHPRYIDVSKCTGCGECADVCPVVIPSRFDEGLVQQRAAHKLYPQAAPNAYAIEKRGIAPCRDACPTGQRAQGYIALIREGRYHDALRVIKEDNPFPGICGRICNHRCENACNRSLLDDPINIRALKRFVTDKVYAGERIPPEACEIKYAQRVAIIGAGPCGLTAAQDLCKLGYRATVFEALPVPGGMLRVGVPEYRLPSWIVDREVADIVDLGVELRLNTVVDHLDDIFAEGFDAVLIAVGAHEGIRPPIPGADLEGVIVNTVFLRDVRLGKLPELGKRVAVIGAGDVAMDVARTAVRLGSEVHLYYRRTRAEATAGEEEIRHAEEEGVRFHFQVSPVEVIGENGRRVTGMMCVRTEPGLPDATGRRRPVTIPGSEYLVPCDNVIFSVGQRAGLAFIPESAGVGVTDQATIAVNPNTMAATRPGVFAAGDAITGTAFVIEAVQAGHRAAESIHRYLRGEELEPPPRPELPVVRMSQADVEERVARGEVRVHARVPMDELPVEERLSTFEEVVAGYTDAQAQAEAARCLACGICSECLSCVYQCGVGAVDQDMVAKTQQIEVGAVILAPGFEIYQAQQSAEYGWGRYPNVVTALQFERLLSASGPTFGHVKRPSDGKPAQKIAFLQCVGSRDQSHDYCSSVCCMYATKEAIMAVEHEPDTEAHIFLMDMRAFGKGYEEYYRRAREKYGIRYTRCRISTVKENPADGNLILRYLTDEQTLLEEEFDMVVLSVGMEISQDVRKMAQKLGVAVDEFGFARTSRFQPLQTSLAGVYAIGPFREPKDIPESVVDASGAAAATAELLAPARGALVESRSYPPERDVRAQELRVGVFVCHCGSNIGGFLDVPQVAEYAATLPGVVHAEDNLYSCSQDSIAHIAAQVRELELNRVVVASCTPLTHEPLFQDTIRTAGLNAHLFEMANIRNQCSWVHSHEWDVATKKAKDLVRMAVAKATALRPLLKSTVPVTQSALVIGGGVAGMTAALSLARQGFPVHLVEREAELGGNLRKVRYLVDWGLDIGDWGLDIEDSGLETSPQAYLSDLVKRVQSEPLINVHLQTELVETTGFKGNFTSILHNTQSLSNLQIKHGVTIVATGAVEYKGDAYSYGSDPRILTQQEFEGILGDWETGKSGAPQSTNSQFTNLPNTVVMVQCAGEPSERFCSRICCTTALKNALKLKELNPAAQVTVIYRDIRAYGFKERLYTQAREKGVLFVRYDFDRKPLVRSNGLSRQGTAEAVTTNGTLAVQVYEPQLGQELTLSPDLLVLSMPVAPSPGAHELASKLKIGLDLDGFFMEAHVKLRPVDFASDGVFMAGMAHYPKLLDETIVQAQAAAARAAAILSKESLSVGGIVAEVDPELCVGCLTCLRACPYNVPQIRADLSGVGGIIGAAYINPAQCRGCGICAGECPARAIQLAHYRDEQMEIKINAFFEPAALAA
jgi:heterodisulfide reductase subunit A-like polyferredoxin